MDKYPASGGYTKGMGMQEKYNSWAAAQYREKVRRSLIRIDRFQIMARLTACHFCSQLLAACADPPTSWFPSAPPPNWGVPSRPVSAQATRKSRAAGGTASPSLLNPSSGRESPVLPPGSGGSGNEAFFERLGSSNASRPDHLPPSQGGKYAGFGSSYEPEPISSSSSSSFHPSFSTSSQSAPTLDDLQQNPWGAMSKGWGVFSSALASAGKELNTSVLQPGMNRAQQMAGDDQGEWKKYLGQVSDGAKSAAGWAGQKAGEGWGSVNQIAKERGGVDLEEHMRSLGLGGRAGGGGSYGQLERAEDGLVSPHGGGEGLERGYLNHEPLTGGMGGGMASGKAAAKKESQDWDKDDDEWKDF